MGLFSAFKVLKRVVTGEVIQQVESTTNGGLTKMSLRLKKERGSDEYYVVLAELSPANSQYAAFTKDEFGQFSDAVRTIQDFMVQHRSESKK